jgi:large subunit ribosomal protein L7A
VFNKGGYYMLNALKNEKNLVIGTKQTLKAIKEGKVKVLFVAADAEKHVTRSVEEVAKETKLEMIHVESMKELGKACGIEVSAAMAAILK